MIVPGHCVFVPGIYPQAFQTLAVPSTLQEPAWPCPAAEIMNQQNKTDPHCTPYPLLRMDQMDPQSPFISQPKAVLAPTTPPSHVVLF